MSQKQEIFDADGKLVGVRNLDPMYGSLPNEPVVLGTRRGHYMHTSNGKKYWPMDPRADEVHIEVVAHHLATRCRYNGAVQHPTFRSKMFYSVAEHSVYVSRYIEEVLRKPEYALEGLLHDGSEAYNGDLIRPLKYDPIFREPFKTVEDMNERAGAAAFNLVYPYPKEVKIADDAVTAIEVEQIVPRDPSEDWSFKLHDTSVKAPYQIEMLLPFEAKEQFMIRFEELMRVRHRYSPVASRVA